MKRLCFCHLVLFMYMIGFVSHGHAYIERQDTIYTTPTFAKLNRNGTTSWGSNSCLGCGLKTEISGQYMAVGSGDPVGAGKIELYKNTNLSDPTAWTLLKQVVAEDKDYEGFRLKDDTFIYAQRNANKTVRIFEKDAGGADNWGKVAEIDPSSVGGEYSLHRAFRRAYRCGRQRPQRMAFDVYL